LAGIVGISPRVGRAPSSRQWPQWGAVRYDCSWPLSAGQGKRRPCRRSQSRRFPRLGRSICKAVEVYLHRDEFVEHLCEPALN
jgi:hypothetical protein